MNQTLFIVCDRGLLKAYLERKPQHGRPPSLERIEEWRPESANLKRSEQVSDQAGRFPQGSGAMNISGNLSAGESLPAEEELERREIDELAGRINALLADAAVGHCFLAASAPIHKLLVDALVPDVRAKIDRVLALNLAKTDPGKLRSHFDLQ